MIDHRVITVREPWCSLLAYGVKRFETRTRLTSFRGLVFLHAGLFVGDGPRALGEQYRSALHIGGLVSAAGPHWFAELPRGAIVGAARLVECESCFDVIQAGRLSADEERVGDWADERWAWRMADAVAFKRPVLGWRGNVTIQPLDEETYGKAVNELQQSATPEQFDALKCNERGERLAVNGSHPRALRAVEADLSVTE